MSTERISNTQGALEVAVNLSRKLPQLGVSPEDTLRLAAECDSKQAAQTSATACEKARDKSIKKEPKNQGHETFPWGFYSAAKAYLKGTLDNPSQIKAAGKPQDP